MPTDGNEVLNGNRWRDTDDMSRGGDAVPTGRNEMRFYNRWNSHTMPDSRDSMSANTNGLLDDGEHANDLSGR